MNIKSVIKIFTILVLISGVSVIADPVYSKFESDAFPKGYYDGDSLPEKTVYLTFDDGPSDWTNGILDVLKTENVKATFFISGYWNNKKMKGSSSFYKHKEALKRIVAEGHVIGNHSAGHKVLNRLSSGDILREFEYNQTLLNGVLGAGAPVMTLLRPALGCPWTGRSSIKTKMHIGNIIRKRWIVAMWTRGLDSTDSWDWAKGEWYRSVPKIDRGTPGYIKKKRRIYNRVIDHANGKGIVVLMHDTHLTTRDTLPGIISELKKKGYRFCTMEDFVVWKYGKGSRELLGI